MARQRSEGPQKEKKATKTKAAASGAGKHSENERSSVGTRMGKTGSKLNVSDILIKENYPLRAYKNTPAQDKKLDGIKSTILSTDAHGEFAMSPTEFEQSVGSMVSSNLQKMHDDKRIQGGLMRLPKRGKAFIVGDIHEQLDHLLAAVDKAELDKNPHHKIIFLGDALSPSKIKEPNNKTPQRESTYRVLTWLRARYPDQIIAINGNHEMGIMAAVNGFNSDDEHTRDAIKIGSVDSMSLKDKKAAAAIISLSPNVIQIGDKTKGEFTRTMQHGSGIDKDPIDIDEVAKADTPEKRVQRLKRFFVGKKTITEEGLKKANAASRSDKTYFGHIDPEKMSSLLDSGEVKSKKRRGAVAELDGGGVFIDSQSKALGGIVEIDLEDDSKPDTIHLIADLVGKKENVLGAFGAKQRKEEPEKKLSDEEFKKKQEEFLKNFKVDW
jgi:hypothetical protein